MLLVACFVLVLFVWCVVCLVVWLWVFCRRFVVGFRLYVVVPCLPGSLFVVVVVLVWVDLWRMLLFVVVVVV